MKKDVAEKWVAALRSGKYEKGTCVLKTSDGRYCCLGVLTEVMGFPIDAKDVLLSKETMEACEMKSYDGTIIGPKTDGSVSQILTRYNDGAYGAGQYNMEPHSFAQIADIIEQNWEKL